MSAWRAANHAEDTIGPYRTLSFLGRGAFGEVLLAEDSRQKGQLVALKIATCCGLGEEEAEKVRSLVLGEAELLRKLQHPNIVGCRDVCWDSERCQVWLALELMDGGSVRNLLENRKAMGLPFDANFLRRILNEIGGALSYIHSQGVLHRDVKPANILLTLSAPPLLKLADFGISKILQATGHAQSIVGTQYYFSPELASGRPYGPASDAWALGVCLYELATLRRPFLANSPFALAMSIVEDAPPALPVDIGQDLERVIYGLLEKDAERRLKLHEATAPPECVAGQENPTDEAVVLASSEIYTACTFDDDTPVRLPTMELAEADCATVEASQPRTPAIAFGPPSVAEPGSGGYAGTKSRGGVGGGWLLSIVNALRPSGLSLSSKAPSSIAESSEKKATLVTTISPELSPAQACDLEPEVLLDDWKRPCQSPVGEEAILLDADDSWDLPLPGHAPSRSVSEW